MIAKNLNAVAEFLRKDREREVAGMRFAQSYIVNGKFPLSTVRQSLQDNSCLSLVPRHSLILFSLYSKYPIDLTLK